MGRQTVIQDVCNVVITDILTENVVANTYMQISGLEGTINEEDLRAGIGNGKIFKIRSEKDLNLNFTSAVFDSEWLAMTQGVEIVGDKEAVVAKAERLIVKGGKVTIADYTANREIVSGSIRVSSLDGIEEGLDHLDGVVTITGGDENEEVNVSYQETIVGSSIEFDAATFSRKYRVDMSTIAYDLETATIYSDIYFIFPETIPGGDFNLSFEAGSAITPELTFSVLQPRGTTVMGEMIEVPRPKI